jgi:hypothetical protein
LVGAVGVGSWVGWGGGRWAGGVTLVVWTRQTATRRAHQTRGLETCIRQPHPTPCLPPPAQVTTIVNRGLLRRVFAEWRRLVEARWWKNQCAMREREVQALEAKIRGYEKRPVTVRLRVDG